MPDAAPDPSTLSHYFRQHVPGFEGSLRVELIQGGRSNLTYLVTDGTTRWVLRRPPFGLVAPTANDLSREFRVVAALGPTAVPVARAVAFCDDLSVIGSPFSVVSMVEGPVLRSASDAAAISPEDADRLTTALVTGLSAIHAVPYDEVGLGDLGRPAGYLERQVHRWRRQWEIVGTRPLPPIAELHAKLAAGIPVESDATIVHGDYRLDNTILDPGDNARLAAIVDWEMATLGDPLADLGLLLVYWDPISGPIFPDGHAIEANQGFPPAGEVARRYTTASGRSLDNLRFYQALGYFKLAVIAEGIHNRYLAGKTVGEGFDTVGQAVAPLVEAGLRALAS